MGGGKTSLMFRAHSLVETNLAVNWKTIWFDAWEYERLDPKLSLMQTIAAQSSSLRLNNLYYILLR